jgi:ABC-type sugar transport system permease subunit/ABC-type glycerol-3-phosphate transport system substrate-binding protein
MRARIKSRRGQIPLWFAGVLLGVLLLAVSLWTWKSTRTSSADGRTQIVFWNATGLGDDVYSALHDFEIQNPQYQVIASSSASQDLTSDGQRLLCAVAGEVPPDLVWFDRFAIGEWAARGALVDLNPYLQKQKASDPYRINLNDYYKFTLDEARYRKPGTHDKQGLFGLPTTLDIRVLFSNADQLRQAGLVDAEGNPQPPRNWAELRADAKLLTHYNPDGSISRLGFAPNFGNSWLYMYAFQAGGHLLSEDGTKVTMASAPVVRALRFMTDIYDDLGGYEKVDGFQSGFENQSGSALDPFLKGQVSMKIDGDWAMRVIAQWKPDMDFIVTPAPMPQDRLDQGIKPVTWAGGFSLVIPSTAREKDGAFKLMQFLTSRKTYHFLEEGTREAAESQGQLYIPTANANRTLYEARVAETIEKNPNVPATFKKAIAVLEQLLPDTLIRPPSAIGQLLWNQHVHAYEEAVNHKLASQYKDENKEIEACLTEASFDPQRALDAIVKPLPPHKVKWGIYFLLYGVLLVVPFFAMYVALRRSRRYRIYRPGETRTALMFLSPWLIGMVCITAGPILFSIILSFTRYDVISPARYVGWQNYTDLFRDPLFYKSMGNTAFMLLRIPLGMAVSLAIAMMLNRKLHGIGAYRTAFYLPTIVPVVAATLLWQALLNDSFGLVDIALRWLFSTWAFHGIEWVINGLQSGVYHMESAFYSMRHWPLKLPDGQPAILPPTPFHFTAPQWLEAPTLTKPSLILMGLWSAGGGMIIWLAGLQSIPAQLYEAATVDGATKWRQFLHVTIPMLSPYILFNAIMGVIGTMQIFTEAFIMFNNGGNDDSALFYAFYLFRKAFQYFSMGYASAMAWLLFIVVLVLTLIQLYLSKKWVHYDQT